MYSGQYPQYGRGGGQGGRQETRMRSDKSKYHPRISYNAPPPSSNQFDYEDPRYAPRAHRSSRQEYTGDEDDGSGRSRRPISDGRRRKSPMENESRSTDDQSASSADESSSSSDQSESSDGDGGSSSSSDSQLNVDLPLKPIGQYIGDRAEMARQMFRALKGARLSKMTPKILKKVPLEELQQLCADELAVMSKKRIRCLIAGEDMNSSSGTEESSDSEAEPDKPDLDLPSSSTSMVKSPIISAEKAVADSTTLIEETSTAAVGSLLTVSVAPVSSAQDDHDGHESAESGDAAAQQLPSDSDYLDSPAEQFILQDDSPSPQTADQVETISNEDLTDPLADVSRPQSNRSLEDVTASGGEGSSSNLAGNWRHRSVAKAADFLLDDDGDKLEESLDADLAEKRKHLLRGIGAAVLDDDDELPLDFDPDSSDEEEEDMQNEGISASPWDIVVPSNPKAGQLPTTQWPPSTQRSPSPKNVEISDITADEPSRESENVSAVTTEPESLVTCDAWAESDAGKEFDEEVSAGCAAKPPDWHESDPEDGEILDAETTALLGLTAVSADTLPTEEPSAEAAEQAAVDADEEVGEDEEDERSVVGSGRSSPPLEGDLGPDDERFFGETLSDDDDHARRGASPLLPPGVLAEPSRADALLRERRQPATLSRHHRGCDDDAGSVEGYDSDGGEERKDSVLGGQEAPPGMGPERAPIKGVRAREERAASGSPTCRRGRTSIVSIKTLYKQLKAQREAQKHKRPPKVYGAESAEPAKKGKRRRRASPQKALGPELPPPGIEWDLATDAPATADTELAILRPVEEQASSSAQQMARHRADVVVQKRLKHKKPRQTQELSAEFLAELERKTQDHQAEMVKKNEVLQKLKAEREALSAREREMKDLLRKEQKLGVALRRLKSPTQPKSLEPQRTQRKRSSPRSSLSEAVAADDKAAPKKRRSDETAEQTSCSRQQVKDESNSVRAEKPRLESTVVVARGSDVTPPPPPPPPPREQQRKVEMVAPAAAPPASAAAAAAEPSEDEEQLELYELELRARAIKALMRRRDTDDDRLF